MQIFDNGIRIPIHGDKLIEEFVGVQRNIDKFSVAHMIMPRSWSEPAHGTKFDELIIVIRGVLTIKSDKTLYKIEHNQVGWLEPCQSVVFCNENADECEYWSICIPAYCPCLVSTVTD